MFRWMTLAVWDVERRHPHGDATRAELIPCSIIDEGDWRFQITPRSAGAGKSLLAAGDPLPAGKYMLDAMMPLMA